MRIIAKIKKYSYPLLLLLVVAMLFSSNYKEGTYLLGWDSLQTELKPSLAVKRALFSGWQEYQSFGLTSGMAHSADLIRAVFLWLVSFIVPQSIVRYFFHLLMVYLGGLGLFSLLKYLGFSKDKQVLAFIGASFYMLNLGTVQIMSLPFEPFSVFLGLLPWEIYAFLKFSYAKKITPSLLFVLVFVNILATPQAYLQTLFIVYMMCLGFLAFGIFLENYSLKLVKRFIIAFSLIVFVNLFWILPQVYFVGSSISVVKEAKINQLATDIVNNQNFEKGNLKNFSRLEGFYYDLYDTNDALIFAPWHAHFSNFFVNVLSYLPFVILLIGLFKIHRSHYGFVSIFVLVSLILLSNTHIFSFFNSLIFSHSFVSQIFRSPFTKFIVPFSLVYSYLFVSGLEIIYNKFIVKDKRGKFLDSVIFTSVSFLLVVIYALPAFLGHYFADGARVKIPHEYMETIRFFENTDKNKRIALLPDYTFWGWFNHKWGYDGSGFLWYGIEQPVVSRTFDVWNLNSESYYWEIKEAIESIDRGKFEAVAGKYQIDYFILEKELNPVSSVEEGMQYDQLKKILENSKKIQLVKSMGSIDIYEVTQDKRINSFVSLAKNIPSAGPEFKITNDDEAYFDLGTYKIQEDPDYFYPFLDFTTQTRINNRIWTLSENDNAFILTANLPDLELSQYILDENTVPLEARVFLGKELVNYEYEVDSKIYDNKIVVSINKEFVENFDPTYVDVSNCRGSGDFGVMKRGGSLSIEAAERGMACFGYSSTLMDHWNGYLVKVDSENISGNNLFFYIFGNQTRKQSKLETNLAGGTEYFVLNPGYYYDDGYFFSFQNTSYESIRSENKLNLLEIYLFPYDYIKNIRLAKKNNPTFSSAIFKPYINVKKNNYYVYEIHDVDEDNLDIVLNQSFDPGWKAYRMNNYGPVAKLLPFYYGDEIEDHYLVNNWANGWKVPESQKGEYILLFFWPQLLEYIGIAALFVVWTFAFIWVFLRTKSYERYPEEEAL